MFFVSFCCREARENDHGDKPLERPAEQQNPEVAVTATEAPKAEEPKEDDKKQDV